MDIAPRGGLQFQIDNGKIVDRNKFLKAGLSATFLDSIEAKIAQETKLKNVTPAADTEQNPFTIKEVKLHRMARVIRTPEQIQFMKELKSSDALFALDIRILWSDEKDADVHLLLPDGTHIFYANPSTDCFSLFVGPNYQNIIGSSNELGSYAVWYTGEGTPMGIVDFKPIRPLLLNGDVVSPGMPTFFNIPNGEAEYEPSLALKIDIDLMPSA